MPATNRPRQLALLLMVAGIALLAAMALLLISSGPAETPAAVLAPGEAARVELAEAKTAYDTGSALFIDVRDADAYAVGHVPGALNIPLAEIAARLVELDPAAPIITYCT